MTTTLEQIEKYVEERIIKPVQDFFTKEEPVLETAWSGALDLLKRNGGDLLQKLAVDCLPLLATMQWGPLTAKLIADAVAAGVVFAEQEEQLAASTAIQIAQAAAASVQVKPQLEIQPSSDSTVPVQS